MYNIELNDGTTLTGFTLYDNALQRDEPVTADMLNGKLSPVTISGQKDDNDEEDFDHIAGTHAHMAVAYIRRIDGKYRVALYDIPADTFNNARRDANIEYIALMAGIDL